MDGAPGSPGLAEVQAQLLASREILMRELGFGLLPARAVQVRRPRQARPPQPAGPVRASTREGRYKGSMADAPEPSLDDFLRDYSGASGGGRRRGSGGGRGTARQQQQPRQQQQQPRQQQQQIQQGAAVLQPSRWVPLPVVLAERCKCCTDQGGQAFVTCNVRLISTGASCARCERLGLLCTRVRGKPRVPPSEQIAQARALGIEVIGLGERCSDTVGRWRCIVPNCGCRYSGWADLFVASGKWSVKRENNGTTRPRAFGNCETFHRR